MENNGNASVSSPGSNHAAQSRKATPGQAEQLGQEPPTSAQDTQDAIPEETVVVKDLDTGRAINVQKVGLVS